MAAVVAPVGVNDAQLRHGGVAVLLIGKIMLAESKILQAHGKAHGVIIPLQLLRIPGNKAAYPCNAGRDVCLLLQCLGLFQRSQAAFYRVDQVGFDFLHLPGRNISGDSYHTGGHHSGPLPLCEQLHALRGGVCALVILAG